MTLDFMLSERPDGTLHVRTDGLVRRGRPELELSEVPYSQLDGARELLRRVAEMVAERPTVLGRPMLVDPGFWVELSEGEHIQAGRFARGLGPGERTVLRVTDPGRGTAERMLNHLTNVVGHEVRPSTTSMSVPGT